MPRFGRRISAVSALVAVVLLLVPMLAWLQYRWVGQVSEAERDRMQRTLRTAAGQFATDFDGELSRAVVGLQVDGAMLRDENWGSYAQRYSTWRERALDPRLVRDVLVVDLVPDAAATSRTGRTSGGRDEHAHGSRSKDIDAADLRIRRWQPDTLSFVPAEWTGDLESMRGPLATHLGEIRMMRTPAGRFRREGPVLSVSDDYTLVGPVTIFEFDGHDSASSRVEVIGFTLVRLDPVFLRDTLLPTLTARHLHGDDGTPDYRMAVTEREAPSTVIWESPPGAAAAIGNNADVRIAFMSPRPDQIMMMARGAQAERRDGERRTGQPPPSTPAAPGDDRIVISVMQQRRGDESRTGRGFSPFEGRWVLRATHRAGSLEAAVAAVRTRNLMLSSGILMLLTAAIGLIAISARRAQTLARQQMEFVATVSHELRTPVSVIRAAASNLADGVVADPARVRKYGATIQDESRRLGETVERVLQLAGIAAGTAAAGREPVNVMDLVQQSLAACRSEIEARGVQVELEIADDLPPVFGDPSALRSALQNLISNGVKYGGDARWLRITAAPVPRRGRAGTPAPSDAAGSRATHVAIAVSDHGLGIDAEDRKKVFEPFYRGRDAVSRQIQGSGLGLNLVARIAEAHAGRVDLISEPGRGSTFTLTLPAAPQMGHEPAAGWSPVPDHR